MATEFDLVVIGAGPGGYVAAIRAAQLGMKVACVEKGRTLGGTCLNVGCIPSKAMLDSSELYHLAKERFGKHGIKFDGIKLDLAAMLARKDEVVKGLTDGVRFLFRKNQVETVFGTARVSSPTSVQVALNEGGKRRPSDRPHLAGDGLGAGELAVPAVRRPDGRRFDRSALLRARFPTTWWSWARAISGSSWARSGSGWGRRSRVIEFLPRIVPTADQEMGDLLKKSLTKQGLEFHLETKVTGSVDRGRPGDRPGRDRKMERRSSFECERVLVAVGRRPYTQGLGLAEAGVSVDPKTGKVPVDAQFRTNVPTISAIGDLIDGPMLAHKAEDEGIAFAEILAGKAGHVNYDTIPGVIYTWPELASVGLNEEQAKQRGLNYRVGKFPFVANGRAKAMDETEGLVKILADASTDRVLGVHILGPRRLGNDRRGGDGHGVRRQCRGHRADLPRPPDALRSHARGGAGRRRPSDSQLAGLSAILMGWARPHAPSELRRNRRLAADP